MNVKDTHARVPCFVARYGRGDYRAHAHGAAQPTVEGRGSTEKEARADLAAKLAWATHVSPDTVLDGEGTPWLVYPCGEPGTWTARRLDPTNSRGLSSGCTVFGDCPNWSAAKRKIAEWNAPQETSAPA